MKLTLVNKKAEATATKTFFFEPVTKLNYKAGQFIYLTLPKLNYPDPRGATRHFTLSSSPTEKLLSITTRMREQSGFKKTLDELSIGSAIEGRGPNGVFYMDENTTGNHIFLAGGIGITPFRSMIKFIVDKNFEVPIYLIYSNSNADEIAFKNELANWTKIYDFFKMESVITTQESRIDALKIRKFIKNWRLEIGNSTWWVSGPPPMVTGIEEILETLKIPADQIKSEKFTGY